MNALTKFSSLLASCAFLAASCLSAATFYPQSNPSNQEQYMLELINRARANPAAEGQMLAAITDPDILRYYQYYGVDTNALISQFAGYAAQPPLALNPDLEVSSQEQSIDQATHGFQGHDSSDGTTFDVRISNAGYVWHAVGENVFAYAEDPFFAHVAFNADWGVPSLGHRANIMNIDPTFPVFKEIGISYVSTSVAGFGPFVVTEDFGTPSDPTIAYVLGVVYNDANNNGCYDMGEGLGGVTITTDSGYTTQTSASGGYVLPLPTTGSGSITVVASGGGLGAPRTTTVSYTVGTNVKVDFTLNSPAGPALPVVHIKASVTDLTPGGAPGELKIARSGDQSQPLTIALNVSGTAVAGVDMTALPSSVTIPAGSASVSLSVQPLNPAAAPGAAAGGSSSNASAPSATKRVKVQLQNGAGYLVSADAAKAKAAVKIWVAAN